MVVVTVAIWRLTAIVDVGRGAVGVLRMGGRAGGSVGSDVGTGMAICDCACTVDRAAGPAAWYAQPLSATITATRTPQTQQIRRVWPNACAAAPSNRQPILCCTYRTLSNSTHG